MASFVAMVNKRTRKRNYWITVGAVTDKMIRDLKEIARLERVATAALTEVPAPPLLTRDNGAGTTPEPCYSPISGVEELSGHASTTDLRQQRPLVDSIKKVGAAQGSAAPTPTPAPAVKGPEASRRGTGLK